ncbi:uncharacterized protein LOC114349545 isoform X3 [Ostrinia furnacalis]|uniref:uncharacterized protein LOC114349545 isoform X3 n=1 Tax=Ostrinia furnacalis TaxID=93504 RepID=UPI00103CC8C6|nr:uncharacterized protein LOC114349545 isoform X3 [Ostrinia furnacalis]
MEEEFEKLKKQGKNDVEHLVQWMKDSKIIDNTKEAEEKARRLFDDAANKQSVELSKFKQALEKLAVQQKKNVEDFTKTLAEQGPKLLSALQAGASAFKDAMTKK